MWVEVATNFAGQLVVMTWMYLLMPGRCRYSCFPGSASTEKCQGGNEVSTPSLTPALWMRCAFGVTRPGRKCVASISNKTEGEQ